MKKLYFLDEEEKNRILNIHEGATKRQYLGEQTLSVDEQIAKEFYDNGALGMGTNPDYMVNALNKITSAEQFWKVNELVKNRPKNSDKLDIAGVINDEFEYYNEDIDTGESNNTDLDKIIAKLTKLGITSTIKKKSAGIGSAYAENTFKITSKPVVVVANTNNGLTDAAIACIKQYGEPKPAKTPGFVFVNTEDDESVFFSKDYEVRYRLTDGKIIYGQWACKSNIFTIMTDDDETWSKAQGGWKGTQPKTAVVDPKKAYQERAKQVNQQTTDTTKQIQQALGQDPTGNLDALYIDKVIDLLKQ
jgi:hypothetical protein